ISALDWRGAYQVLGVYAIFGATIAFFLTKENETAVSRRRYAKLDKTENITDRRGSPAKLITIAIMAFLASAATLSLVPHLPALLIDRGLNSHRRSNTVQPPKGLAWLSAD
ncbi:hypothetical protein BZM27_54775, partial [Paraburkholderia steynii]